ncbi:MAG: oxidoreductase [Planctomyces sp.]|nr:oxidoreductase [Planctomyces sp.]
MEGWTIPWIACSLVIGAPVLLLATLGLALLLETGISERMISRLVQFSVLTGLTGAVAMLVWMLATGERDVPFELGNWVSIPQQHFHFRLKFLFDRLSIPFAIMTYLLVGTIGAFADKYLHREPGFRRFFMCYSLFLLGMILSTLAGTIETLFAGWELVGLSSALLVAFFQERPAPVRNGLRVWTVYRIADAAFIVAAVSLHHLTGEGDFDALTGYGAWPTGQTTMSAGQALFVGSLLLVAAAGKSGLVPFSGWLPRAMEGPTPSSAVFYGALSVHLGAFLLLRVSPILERSPLLCGLVVGFGLATAAVGALSARTQTDIKSALAFACVTQVGIITAEIGLGFRYLALCHIIGHASLRTLQMLRAPSILRDYHTLENAIGGRLAPSSRIWQRMACSRIGTSLYRLGFERGGLDASLDRWIVRPFLKLLTACDGWERRWTDFLSGGGSRESDQVRPAPQPLEELL